MADDEERDCGLDAVILRRELLDDGFTDSQIQAMVRSGELARVRHGTYSPVTGGRRCRPGTGIGC